MSCGLVLVCTPLRHPTTTGPRTGTLGDSTVFCVSGSVPTLIVGYRDNERETRYLSLVRPPLIPEYYRS